MVGIGSILPTKLHPPLAGSALVPRPRLIERLSALRPLTLVVAPAGYGKTTLVGEWIAQLEHPVTWLSLDEDDNDPTRFLTYFIAALQVHQPNLGDAVLPLLQSPHAPSPKIILTTLVHELTALSTSLVLVLDDYHVIATRPIHEALAFLLDHQPPQFHVVITSRADPPLPLARWRVRNRLAELRANDLRFTSQEAGVFLNQVMGLRLAADEIAVLEARTEGWIAGLHLAALSMQGHHDGAEFIAAFTGSHRYIVDYLAEEVFQRQPEPIQNFLLQTSILDRLSGPLCDALTEQSDSRLLLEQLERANLFIIPLDNERTWYRYHHLFADVLHGRLQQTRPALVSELCRRASAWHEDHGMLREATTYALAAPDFKRAARLIAQLFHTLWIQGELATLLTWIKALPEDELRAHPQGNIGYAWLLAFVGQAEAAETRLQLAEEILRDHPPAASAVLDDLWGQVIALRARLAAHRGDWRAAVDFAEVALARLSPASTVFRGGVYYSRALAYRLGGDLSTARRASAEASAFGWESGNYLLAVNSERNAALAQTAQGRLHEAAGTYRQTLAKALASAGRPLPVTGIAHVGYAELCYQWNDLDAAARYIQTGLELGRQGGLADILFYGGLILAQLHMAQGDGEAALASLWQIEQLAAHIGTPHAERQIKALEALIQLRSDHTPMAAQWAQAYLAGGVDDTAYAHEHESLTLARTLLAQGRAGETAARLAQLLPAAEAAGRQGSVIEILALQTLALRLRGDSVGALTTLTYALTLAQPEGYIRVFVDEGEGMQGALSDWRVAMARRRSDEVSSRLLTYVDQLLTAFSSQVRIIQNRAQLIEPLSERELEVLRLVATGLSDRAIAEHLILALGTVKKHLNNIYGKLGIHTRTQALARAKELKLL